MLIVETGAGVPGANSYILASGAQEFLGLRGFDISVTEGLLLRAMDHLSTIRYLGTKTSSDNPLPWPRTGVYDCEGLLIPPDSIPRQLINAQIWLAYQIDAGNDPGAVQTPAVKSETVDVISVEYAVEEGQMSSEITGPMSLPNVREALRCLVAAGADGFGGGFIDRA